MRLQRPGFHGMWVSPRWSRAAVRAEVFHLMLRYAREEDARLRARPQPHVIPQLETASEQLEIFE